MAAVQVLQTLADEDRPATAAELETMARFRSWGASSTARMFDEHGLSSTDLERREQLQSALTDEQWRAARRTVLNAHYTDPRLAVRMWQLASDLGFTEGQVLEPGCGTGTFIAAAPETAQMWGVELDPTTAQIAAHLNPDARVINANLTDVDLGTGLPHRRFDLVIGNVPFADLKPHDRRYNPHAEHSLHNYALIKALHQTAPGGLVVALTSRYTLDARNPASRRAMHELGHLVAAVRLPSGAHRDVAGTEAITDLVVFARRHEPLDPNTNSADAIEPDWITSRALDRADTNLVSDTMQVEQLAKETVNDYWRAHPDHVLGTMAAGHGLYGHGLVIESAGDLATQLDHVCDTIAGQAEHRFTVAGNETAASRSGGAAAPQRVAIAPDVSEVEGTIRPASTSPGSISTGSGTGAGFEIVDGSQWRALDVPAARQAELRQLVGLRELTVGLLRAEAASSDDTEQIARMRTELSRAYDTYVDQFGPLNRFAQTVTKRISAETGEPVITRRQPAVMATFRRDPYALTVFALEDFDGETQTATKAAIMTRRVVVPRQPRRGTDSPAEAVAICQDLHGDVRLDTIAALLGCSPDEAITTAAGHLYLDPSTQKWVPAAEYLSGDVRTKLTEALAAAEADPDRWQGNWKGNVEALQRIQPEPLGPAEISVQLGASWVPASDVQAFLRETLDSRVVEVVHAGGSEWKLSDTYGGGVAAHSTYGTDRLNGFQIAERLLRQTPIQIFDEIDTVDGTRRVLNAEATLAAQEKAEELNERFAEWVWDDPARSSRLAGRYNELFNNLVLRHYDGDHLSFPGLAASFAPRPHQRAAVARMIAEPAVGLFHEVGAGKTAEMAMGCMELKRLGLVTKPAVVVPNHMLEQFSREWLQCYPQARLLAGSSADLAGDKRRQFVARAATGEWDAVILTRGAFQRLDVSADTITTYVNSEIDQQRERLGVYREAGISTKKIEAQIARLEENLKRRLDSPRDPGISFEESGIDYLCIDELHDYKNLSTPSSIPGAAIDGSQRATDLHMKIDYLRHRHGGRVITGATATPLANSITEAWVVQRYLRPDLLDAAGLTDFDSWAAVFGKVETGLEFTPAGQLKMKARFAKFTNVPELLRMWHVAGDVQTAEDLNLPTPPLRRDPTTGERTAEVVHVPRSEALATYMGRLGQRADNCSGHSGPGEDNILVVTSDGRKAALDMRLLSPDEMAYLTASGYHDADPTGGQSKITAAADEIAAIHTDHADRIYLDPATGEPHPRPGGLQIVFCDLGTPQTRRATRQTPPDQLHLQANPGADPDGDVGASDVGAGEPVERFSVYDELRTALVDRGVPAEQIRFIHEARNDADKARLFAQARTGGIAVLIGSTAKMGVGTNVQARAVALHHLDCPWRPADLAQRDGRVKRQGNQNDEIRILRYVTSESFDATMWQTVSRKATFIGQLMKGRLDVREVDDIGEAALDAAQIAAAVSGDNRLLIRAQTEAEVQKLQRLSRAHDRSQAALAHDVTDLTAQIEANRTTHHWAAHHASTHTTPPANSSASGHQIRIAGPDGTLRAYGDRGDAAAALHHQLAGRNYLAHTTPIAEIDGVSLQAQPHRTIEGTGAIIAPHGLDTSAVHAVIPVKAVHHDATPEAKLGILSRLENLAERIPDYSGRLDTQHDQLQHRLAQTRDRVGLPFKRADDLAAARRDLAQINADLAGDLDQAAQRASTAANPTDLNDRTGIATAAQPAQTGAAAAAYTPNPAPGRRPPTGPDHTRSHGRER